MKTRLHAQMLIMLLTLAFAIGCHTAKSVDSNPAVSAALLRKPDAARPLNMDNSELSKPTNLANKNIQPAYTYANQPQRLSIDQFTRHLEYNLLRKSVGLCEITAPGVNKRCTCFLSSPNEIRTSLHCAYPNGCGQRPRIRFRLGFHKNVDLGSYLVTEVSANASCAVDVNTLENTKFDWVTLRLASTVRDGIPLMSERYMAAQIIKLGDLIVLPQYAADMDPNTLYIQRDCSVLGYLKTEDVLQHNCGMNRWSSGAPLIVWFAQNKRWGVVGMNASTAGLEQVPAWNPKQTNYAVPMWRVQ